MELIKKFFLNVCCIALLFSCSDNKQAPAEDEIGEDSLTTVSESQKISAQNIFNSIPSPQEFTEIVYKTGLEYDGLILNNPDNYKKYSSDDTKALSLGVYGTDLSYTSVFEQTQESMLFLKCVNQACKSLGISGVFDERTFDRIEANKQNKDSLLLIISKSFWNADKFLRENQRSSTSSLMLTGGWIEGLYLAMNAAKTTKDKKIAHKIADQKHSLKDIINLLEGTKMHTELSYLLDDLKGLKAVFESAPEFNNPKKEGLDKEVETFIQALDGKITSLRNKITQNA